MKFKIDWCGKPEQIARDLQQLMPSDLELMFCDKIKWYLIRSYKFGEIAITEATLKEMIITKDIYAYAYVMYRDETNMGMGSDKEYVWNCALSFKIIFGVIERKDNSIDDLLRTGYHHNTVQLSSFSDVKDAPPTLVMKSIRVPILRLEENGLSCNECEQVLIKVKNDEPVYCLNKNCSNFTIPNLRLDHFDFETGPMDETIDGSSLTKASSVSNCVHCRRCKICANVNETRLSMQKTQGLFSYCIEIAKNYLDDFFTHQKKTQR